MGIIFPGYTPKVSLYSLLSGGGQGNAGKRPEHRQNLRAYGGGNHRLALTFAMLGGIKR